MGKSLEFEKGAFFSALLFAMVPFQFFQGEAIEAAVVIEVLAQILIIPGENQREHSFTVVDFFVDIEDRLVQKVVEQLFVYGKV